MLQHQNCATEAAFDFCQIAITARADLGFDMRVLAVALLAFLALAITLSRPHQFAPLPTKQMPAVNVPDK